MTENSSTPASHNIPEYTVGEVSAALKRTVETAYARIKVRGEISGFKRAASGHLYFALKDSEALLDAICWKGQALRLSIAPEDGLEVICTGRLTTYPGRSKYQMVVESMELAGQGALLKLLEDRKRRLEAEGLFAPERKRKIPYLPTVIGVVTSPTGAVIRDILHRLRDRFPRHVLLWPVLVQGETAAPQIAAAIEGFNRLEAGGRVPRPDVLIVARGGGSLEDLWPFNEEIVVRAAAASAIPLISAVGHETDVTLIDFAADLRAPTPTAAAEMAVPVRGELLAQTLSLHARMSGAAQRQLESGRLKLQAAARGLPDPDRLLEQARLRLDERAERLILALPNLLARRRAEFERVQARLTHPRALLERIRADLGRHAQALDHAIARRLSESGRRFERLGAGPRLQAASTRLLSDRLRQVAHLGQLLEGFSYQRVLERGFVLVRDADEQPVTAAAALSPGQKLTLHFHDGAVSARTEGPDEPPPRSPRLARKAAKAPSDPPEQGSLL